MEKSKFKISLVTGGVEYKGSGNTFEEAVEALGLEAHNLKIKGIMIVSKGKKKTERLFQVPFLKKLIANKTLRQIWADKFEVLLK